MVKQIRSWFLPPLETACRSVSPHFVLAVRSGDVSMQPVLLSLLLPVTGGFALLLAVRPNFLYCNSSQKPWERLDRENRRKGKVLIEFSSLSRLPASTGVFVVLTSLAGALTNDRYVDGWILILFSPQKILEIPTDRARPTKVSEKTVWY